MMKKLLLPTVFILFISFNCFPATVKSKMTGGEWSVSNSWIGNNVPQDGDSVVIQGPITITNSTIGTFGSPLNFIINITASSLNLIYNAGPAIGSAGMWLTGTSVIYLQSGGQVTSSSNSFFGDINFISLGFDGIIEYLGGRDGTVSGPDIFVGGNSGPLPIELISFDTKLTGEIVKISWATASEINNEFFTLERSVDGINWGIIGEVDGAGNSSERLDYSFVDYNPIPGLSYYRLKQTDYDGQFEHFTPSVILFEPDNLFKVFPNPTVDVIQLTTSSDLKNATIVIKNLSGQEKISKVAASPHQAFIDVSSLPNGVYLLEIAFPESVLSKRIIKK